MNWSRVILMAFDKFKGEGDRQKVEVVFNLQQDVLGTIKDGAAHTLLSEWCQIVSFSNLLHSSFVKCS